MLCVVDVFCRRADAADAAELQYHTHVHKQTVTHKLNILLEIFLNFSAKHLLWQSLAEVVLVSATDSASPVGFYCTL